ncbi:hypothetical protein AB0J72_55175 [Dactylosporangium sp. NPDC049742]|uniref:hypothetical protein n=1 Tax=Dactylosporangium sp. NPDC049742 TaxID=3154737 RepID=UPI00343F7FBD
MSEEPIFDRDAARRLAGAGQWGGLRRLLAATVDTEFGPVNARCHAHQTHGSIDDYLDEVEPARRHADELTDAAVSAGRPAPALHDEIWFGLVTAGLRGRRYGISADLLELAVTEGIWTSRRALTQLHRVGRLVPGHGRSILQLLPHVPEDDRRRLIALASASTAAAEHDYARVYGWVDLLPHLTPEERPATTARILDELRAMDEFTFRNMLPVAAPHLSHDELRQALVAAADHHPGLWRALVAEVAPLLSWEQVLQAMETLHTLESPAWRAEVLAAFVPRLPADMRARALDDILDAAADCYEDFREQLLADIAVHLSAEQLDRAAVLAADSAYLVSRARMLAVLVPHAPDRWLPQLFSTALETADEQARAHLLAALVPRLPDAPRRKALASASALAGPWARAQLLTALVPHLPDGTRGIVIDRALAAAAAVGGPWRGTVLRALIPYLSPERLDSWLDTALAEMAASPDAVDLQLIAEHLADRHWPSVFTAVTAAGHDRKRLLHAFVPHLPDDQLESALSLATTILRGHELQAVMTALAPRLPPERRVAVLRKSLADATVVIGDANERAPVLAALVPHLPADRLPDVLAAGAALSDPSHRAEVLVEVALRLPAALPQALDAVLAVKFPARRAALLTLLAPHLPADLLRRAGPAPLAPAGDREHDVAVAFEEAIAAQRAYALRDNLPPLLPQLSADQLERAHATVLALDSAADRARMLTALVPWLPVDRRAGALREALDAVGEIVDTPWRIRTLAGLAPLLPVADRDSLVADALALTLSTAVAEHSRPQTLVALGPVLSEAQLDRAMAAAVAFDDGNRRRQAMDGLASHLPPPLVTRYAGVAARDTFTMTAMARRASAIVTAEPGQAHVALAVLRAGLAASERRIAYAALAELTGFVAAVTDGDLGPTLDAVLQTAAWWR